MRSASITRLSFHWPIRCNDASALTLERKKKNGTRKASTNVVAALAAKYQWGAAAGWTEKRCAARPVLAAASRSAGRTAPNVASNHSSGPNNRSGTAAIAKKGRMPPDDSVNKSAPANTQILAVTMRRRRATRWAPIALSPSTARNPARKRSSQSRLPRSPITASTAAQVAMMRLPPSALMLHSHNRLAASTDRLLSIPSRSSRSTACRTVFVRLVPCWGCSTRPTLAIARPF